MPEKFTKTSESNPTKGSEVDYHSANYRIPEGLPGRIEKDAARQERLEEGIVDAARRLIGLEPKLSEEAEA